MDKLKVLLIGLFVLLAGYLTMNFLTINAFGERYSYNMSESEIQDEWLTQTCMRLSINSPNCDLVYGGVMDSPSEGKIK